MANKSRPFAQFALIGIVLLIVLAWIGKQYADRWQSQRLISRDLISEHHWNSEDSSAVIDV